ncbi:MAG: hypothetical protein LBE75_01455 [Burkholderiales bacterium]|jgi:uncharacterized membrane protein|nr:hypothetical protein [Burkholderiales bacterium]
MSPVLLPDSQDAAARTLTTIIYGLYALALLFGVTAIVAIVMNYVKKDDMTGTLYESHFRWQIRTFWFALLWSLLSCPFILLLGLGFAFLFVVFVWYVYRIVKGWLRLTENKPMYE